MDATYLFVENFKNITYDDLPDAVVEITKKQVLDLFGVVLAGSGQAGATELKDLVVEWGGAPQSTILGWGHRVPAAHAAQVNATMACALDYDDVHEAAVMHPGTVAVSTALALAEHRGGLSGREFITTIALGSDFICRLGLATRPGENIIATGWHQTSLYGYMTAAAVAGRILDPDTIHDAVGIAYHQMGGNGQGVKDGALTKRMGAGFGVRGGIASAMLAQKGVTGAKECLEGEFGMFRVYHQGAYSREILVADLGARFESVNVSIKPYPCCRGVHPFIDAALTLVREQTIAARDVAGIRVWCGEPSYVLLCTPMEAKKRPRTQVDCQFSIPWGVAVAVARGQATIEDIGASRSGDILDVAEKIEVTIDSVMSRTNQIEPGRVAITMRDGRTFTEEVEFPTGTPQRPLSFADCERKFRDCAAHAAGNVPQARGERLVELVARLEEVADVRELVGLVTF